MKEVKYIKIDQPIGSFYMTSLDASTLAKIAVVERRHENPDAVQREKSDERIKEIAKYCGDTDATFPTPIIIAVRNEANVIIGKDTISFDEDEILGDVIDGQHRVEGIKASNYMSKFQLPVVLMFNLFPEEKAYVFSIINSKQTRVNMSLIYDLFALSKKRSPYKTCHETARAMNKEKESPFFNRLKMLGKKAEGQELASLSQGTFIKYLLELISKNPDDDIRKLKNEEPLTPDDKYVLRQYFIDEKDVIIYKIILNLFSGVRDAFPEEWNNPDEFIISKSIGFGAVIKAFPTIYRKGTEENKLNKEFFTQVFLNFREFINVKGVALTSKYFGSNEQARTELSKMIEESINPS